MICRHCGSEVPDPPLNVARANGYDPDLHCRLKAAQGEVWACCNWLDYRYCETCPRSVPVFHGGEGGREMTKEETKAAIAVMIAWVEGKRIEYRHVGMAKREWDSCDCPDWSWMVTEYRIAPEPKLRPWMIDEVPVGKVVLSKGGCTRLLIVGINLVDSLILVGQDWLNPYQLNHNWTMDDGSPCGTVEVSE